MVYGRVLFCCCSFFFLCALPGPLLSSHVKIRECYSSPPIFLNLPGWRWGSITQNPLVAVSRPLHSGVCETRQDAGLPVLHSKISDSGLLRTRGGQRKAIQSRCKWSRWSTTLKNFSRSNFCRMSVWMDLRFLRALALSVGLASKERSPRPACPWCACAAPRLHRSHFGSRYQSGRCALRSPPFAPRGFESHRRHFFRDQTFSRR